MVASVSWSELGTAQPQLLLFVFLLVVVDIVDVVVGVIVSPNAVVVNLKT